MARSRTKDKELLERIKERFSYATDAWKDIRIEAATDMRYIVGDPWDPADKKDRKDAGRPALSCDELNQYINQANNNLRQNPRGIKIEPAGSGASEKTAEFRQNLIRGIEYRSSAQRSAYTPAAENAMQRSYGFFRISREFVGKTWDQQICIKGIPNPDSVLYDPDVKEADWSDAKFVFVVEPMSKKEFKRRYPKAEVKDFSPEDAKSAPDWIKDDSVMVGEYHEATVKTRKLLLLDTPEGQTEIFEDELPEGSKPKIIKERDYEERTIKKYITNGVEILEETEQPGPYIPIVPVIGKEIYLNEGGTTKRLILSAVRLARDPQMLYAYLCSCEAEEAAQIPKAPFMGYKGQFESDEDAWKSVTKIPHAFLQVDPLVDAASGQTLPLPTRPQYTPNFQQIEVAKESARRAIQSSMGISPLPTAAQRNNEKSGVALERIQSEQAIGFFHFTDNFERSLVYAGKIIDSWIPVVYDTEREVGIQKEDGTHSVVKINTREPYTDEKGAQHHYPIAEADHLVTITTGPSYQSQREEAASFADHLIQNLQALPIPPAQQAQLLAMAIKLRQLGPIGDQMVTIIEGDPNDIAQKGQQAIQQLQQQQQVMQAMQAEIAKLTLDKNAKMVEMQAKKDMQAMDMELERWKLDNARAIAEIQTKAQNAQERAQMYNEVWKEIHSSAHEAGMQAAEQAHERTMAAAQQTHEAGMAEAAANQPEAQPTSSPAGA